MEHIKLPINKAMLKILQIDSKLVYETRVKLLKECEKDTSDDLKPEEVQTMTEIFSDATEEHFRTLNNREVLNCTLGILDSVEKIATTLLHYKEKTAIAEMVSAGIYISSLKMFNALIAEIISLNILNEIELIDIEDNNDTKEESENMHTIVSVDLEVTLDDIINTKKDCVDLAVESLLGKINKMPKQLTYVIGSSISFNYFLEYNSSSLFSTKLRDLFLEELENTCVDTILDNSKTKKSYKFNAMYSKLCTNLCKTLSIVFNLDNIKDLDGLIELYVTSLLIFWIKIRTLTIVYDKIRKVILKGLNNPV